MLGSRYRVRHSIGRGGGGDVFVGDDLLLEREVAIKILHPSAIDDSARLEQFRREAVALASARSPHVVCIHDIGLEREGVYLVMQLVEGKTLEHEISGAGPMSRVRANTVIVRLLDALIDLRTRGLVHRDLKPSSVMLADRDQIVFLDLESSAQPVPEPAGEVHQVGLLLLYVLTGIDLARTPTKVDLEEVIQLLPRAVAVVCRRALAAPAERFRSAAIMKEALASAVEHAGTNSFIYKPVRVTAEMAPTVLASLLTDMCGVDGDGGRATPAPITQSRGRLARVRMPAVKVGARDKVLIVDEDFAFGITLHHMLEEAYDVSVVNTANKALLQLDTEAANVILCGLRAPIEFHDTLRVNSPELAAANIFLTTSTITYEVRAFLRSLTNKSLGKPFELDHLKRLIGDQIAATRPAP